MCSVSLVDPSISFHLCVSVGMSVGRQHKMRKRSMGCGDEVLRRVGVERLKGNPGN